MNNFEEPALNIVNLATADPMKSSWETPIDPAPSM